MKSIPEIHDFLVDQIRERRQLIAQMVGKLYPAILNSEIENLKEAIEALKCYQTAK